MIIGNKWAFQLSSSLELMTGQACRPIALAGEQISGENNMVFHYLRLSTVVLTLTAPISIEPDLVSPMALVKRPTKRVTLQQMDI